MRLWRNFGYAGALGVLRLAAAIAVIPAMTRSLGISGFGEWTVMTALLGLAPVAQCGLGPAVSYSLATATSSRLDVLESSKTMFIILGGATAATVVITAPAITSLLVPGSERALTVPAFRLIGVAIFLQFARHWAIAVEAGLQRFDIQAWIEGGGTVATNLGLVVLCLLDRSLVALACWTAVASLGTLSAHCSYLSRTQGVRWLRRPSWNQLSAVEMLAYGWRQWISQVSSVSFGQVDRLVVNAMLGTGAAGLYGAVTAVASRINELSAAPVQVIAPALAQNQANRDHRRAAGVFLNAYVASMALCYFLSAAVMLAAAPLSAVLVSGEFAPSAERMLRIAALTYGLFSASAAGYFAALGLGVPAVNAKWGLAGGAVFLLGLVVLLEFWGLPNAVWANLGYSLMLGSAIEVSRMLAVPVSWWGTRFLCFAVGLVAMYTVTSLAASPPFTGIKLVLLSILVLAHVFVAALVARSWGGISLRSRVLRGWQG